MCSPEEFCDFIYGCLKSKFNLFLACAGLLYCSYMYLFVVKFMGERGKMNFDFVICTLVSLQKCINFKGFCGFISGFFAT